MTAPIQREIHGLMLNTSVVRKTRLVFGLAIRIIGHIPLMDVRRVLCEGMRVYV